MFRCITFVLVVFRFARHTNRLNELKHFYINVLGLTDLGSFTNHDGYDGIFIGKKGMNWHIEFTQTVEKVNHSFDDDDLLIFYPDSIIEQAYILDSIKTHKLPVYHPKNPYWILNGVMIKDPDGFGVIIYIKA